MLWPRGALTETNYTRTSTCTTVHQHQMLFKIYNRIHLELKKMAFAVIFAVFSTILEPFRM